MRRNEAVGIQDPSASPTYALSRSIPAQDVSPSTRRNLFSSHLSRRTAPPATHIASSEQTQDPFVNTASNRNGHHHVSSRAAGVQPTIFEPSRSPTRSHSPPKQSQQSQIIMVDSLGRPVLPHIPKLPTQLLDNSEDEEDEQDTAMDGEFRSREQSQSSMLSSQNAARLHDLIDTNTNSDFDKIESILSEMQALQKARARTTVPELETPTLGDGVSARTRGKARSRIQEKTDTQRTGIGGVGATLKEEDKDELLGLIMTSLRRRVQDADEDAWIFGDELLTANGVSVTGGLNVGAGNELDF